MKLFELKKMIREEIIKEWKVSTDEKKLNGIIAKVEAFSRTAKLDSYGTKELKKAIKALQSTRSFLQTYRARYPLLSD